MTPTLPPLLDEMVRRGASDLHITACERPKLRIDGRVANSSWGSVLTPEDTLALTFSALTADQKQRFEDEDELDFSFAVEGVSRFRGNAFRQRGCAALAIRQVPLAVQPLSELGLPPVLGTLADRARGLVLVTGPTGSGKSTTLAAMLDRINRERSGHILTIEDPVEFVHPHRGCIVNQREVGTDTKDFARALKSALRQDPDVVLIGEMRDLESIRAALTISETGHLCLATLHTNSAVESVNRIVDVFPSHQQPQVRAQLAFVLEGVVTQTLLPRSTGPGRVVAAEVMMGTPAVRACIREDKVHQIPSLMQAGKKHGMQTLNDGLCQLYLRREVAIGDCLQASAAPEELLRMVGDTVPARHRERR
jgi:twitching motility protein PilT